MRNGSDPLDKLEAVADRVAARKKFREALLTRDWRESEIGEWREEIIRLGDAAPASMEMLDRALAAAKAAGRYTDDQTPWYGNVRAQHKSGWVVMASETALVVDFARFLDRDKPLREVVVQTQVLAPQMNPETGRIEEVAVPGIRAPRVGSTWMDAGTAWARELFQQGRVSQEMAVGPLAPGALPEWLQRTYGPHFTPQDAGVDQRGRPMVSRLVTLEEMRAQPAVERWQRDRWDVWMGVRRIIWSRILRGEPWDTIPPLAGFLWTPFAARSVNWPDDLYTQQTAEAARWLRANREAILTDASNAAAAASREKLSKLFGER